jgi:hypothetical protein
MAGKSGLRGSTAAAVLAVAALGFLLGGCAYSMSEFALERPAPATVAAVAAGEATGDAVPLAPTALVDDDLPRSLGLTAPATTASLPPTATVGGYPSPGPPPNQPDSKLLTPEEKAKVIAELEALARSQKVTPPTAGTQPKCEDETLDPAERLRREKEGIAC